MQLDLETIRWLISGFFAAGGAVITLLLSRQVNHLDRTLEDHDDRIDDAHDLISGIKQDFVSKVDLREQLNIQLSPIKDSMREMKDDIKEVGNDLKSLLKRP